MAGWIKMRLGMDVGLGPGHLVLDSGRAPPHEKEHSSALHFAVHFALSRSPIGATAELLYAVLGVRDGGSSANPANPPAFRHRDERRPGR